MSVARWGYVGNFVSFDTLPDPVKWAGRWATVGTGTTSKAYFSNGTSWEVGGGGEAYWLDPVSQQGAIYNGSGELSSIEANTTAVQASLDVPYGMSFPLSGKKYGKGKQVVSREGVLRVNPLLASTWTAIYCPGHQSSSVWQLNHAALTGEYGLIEYRDDSDQSSGIGSQPRIDGMVLHGDRASYDDDNSTALEHGIFMPELSGDKDDAPLIRDTLVANFAGDGIHINKHHNQVRAFNVKSIANSRYSLYINKNSDSKFDTVGFGRSLEGQVYLEDLASPQFAKFDIWNPSDFIGRYALQLLSCQNARFFQGEINGAVLVQGDDAISDGRTRFQDTSCLFNGVTFKVDPVTATGPYASSYDSLIEVKSATNVTFANCQGGWNGEGVGSEQSYAPKWIWKIGPASGSDEATSGFVKVNNFTFIRKHRNDLDEPKPIFAFKKHWTNRRDRVIYAGRQIGELVCVPTSEMGINLVPADGTALNTEEWPLLWLTMDGANDWDDGGKPSTFTPGAYAPAGTPSHMTWCYVGWL